MQPITKITKIKMPNEFVYITSAPNGKGYRVIHKASFEKYEEDIEFMRKAGHLMVRYFEVPREQVSLAMKACSEFSKGQISLKNLEEKIASLGRPSGSKVQ